MKSKNIWKGKFGPMLIAEIGGNHEGNFKYAKKLVRLAISSGVDVVKLQIYQGANLVSSIESKKRFKHFKKFELSQDQHVALAKMCKKAKVIYLASVWDKKSLQWIDKYLKFMNISILIPTKNRDQYIFKLIKYYNDLKYFVYFFFL